MTADQILAVVSLLLTIGAGFASLAWQQYKLRQEAKRTQYLEAHAEMIRSIGALASSMMGHGDASEAQREYALAKSRFSIIASDDGVKHLAKLDALMANKLNMAPSSDKGKALIGLLRSARIEIHGKTDLTDAELFGATPFSE